ncbi:DUF2332 domain-containing protein [Rhabdothermincola sp.]|uniref:DUF2332 domain-containing protein n=1 Tax=Rhabdothermincola sp. TaxID=2820405 RepID=UPI002FE20311
MSATSTDPTTELADVLVALADGNFRGYSPTYERIARAWAEDPDLLTTTLELRPEGMPVSMLPISLLAVVHELVLREPDLALAAIYRGEEQDPWPAFRDLVTARAPEIRTRLANCSIQTNEVGRSAALIPSLAWITEQLPGRDLALVEIGPSAGLNLLADHFFIEYRNPGGTALATGDPSSPVRLQCDLKGDTTPPLPAGPLPIVARTGIDLDPIDVHDPDATRWLEACLWPGVTDRQERLRRAIELVRHAPHPPRLHAGDVLDLLDPVIEDLPPGAVPVVFSTWALAYLTRQRRQEVHDRVAAHGTGRDIVLLTAEYPHVIPWVPAARRPHVEEGTDATLVGVAWWRDGHARSAPLAWTHAHGAWLDWIGGEGSS